MTEQYHGDEPTQYFREERDDYGDSVFVMESGGAPIVWKPDLSALCRGCRNLFRDTDAIDPDGRPVDLSGWEHAVTRCTHGLADYCETCCPYASDDA